MTSPSSSIKSSSVKKTGPKLPSLRRVIGLLLLFAAIGLSSCQSFFTSFTPATTSPPAITRGMK